VLSAELPIAQDNAFLCVCLHAPQVHWQPRWCSCCLSLAAVELLLRDFDCYTDQRNMLPSTQT
jgi:hypothetical protein